MGTPKVGTPTVEKKQFWAHPLFVTVVAVILTAFATYFITRATTREADLQATVKYGRVDDTFVDYVKGANIAAFIRVADAMLDQGIV